MNKIKVTFEDLRTIEVDYNTRVIDAVNLVENNINKILALKINNEIRRYDYPLVKDSYIEFITFDSFDGYKIYSRTLKMILYMALTKLFSKVQVNFISTINNSQYFTIKDVKLTTKNVKLIKEKMQEYIEKDLPIFKREVSFEEASMLYNKSKSEDKLKNISNRLKSHQTLYFCDDVYNNFYGILAPSTGYISLFDLIPYKEGALLVIPNKNMKLNKEKADERLYEAFINFNALDNFLNISSIKDLNDSILNNNINNVIQTAEAIQDRHLVELALDIEKKKNIKIILIAGPSSSGKTTFAQKLGIQLKLSGYNPITISMDNYFVDRKLTPLGEDGKYDFDSIDSIDCKLFNKQMKELIDSKEVILPKYDFVSGIKKFSKNSLKLKDRDILIIEGIHALNPLLAKFVPQNNKYKIYIAPITTLSIDNYNKVSSTDTRLLRRIVRDYNTRDCSVEKTFELWKNVKKGEEKNIFPYVNTSDYIYNSSLVYEPSVMKLFVQPLLLQVDNTSPYYSESRRLYEFLNNFLPMETSNIPINSIIREFIGNGCFNR